MRGSILAAAATVAIVERFPGMFRASLKPSEQGTLQRRYEFHLGESARAALRDEHEKAAGHSAAAVRISRKLYAEGRDPQQHRPHLAAALATHARYERALESVALLAESAGHYAVLAAARPRRYEVDRIAVLGRVALTLEAAGSTRDAIRLLREVISMYRQVPPADRVDHAAGLARACFSLGRCLMKAGDAAGALACTDEGLRAADAALPGLTRGVRRSCTGRPDPRLSGGVTRMHRAGELSPPAGGGRGRTGGHDPGWLTNAPRHVQLLAPDWIAAATRAMAMHAAAGHWPAAATAARTAVRVSGAVAALGGEDRQEAHLAILGRARSIWAQAREPSPARPSAS